MTLDDYIADIKLNLTGGVTKLEISDETIGELVKSALRKVKRYIDITNYVEVPFANYINLEGFDYQAIINIFPCATTNEGIPVSDPFMAQTLIWSNGYSSYNISNYVYNYLAYRTLNQIASQINGETLDFQVIRTKEKGTELYIQTGGFRGSKIVIEYVPNYTDVSEIVDPYWTDILLRLATGLTKKTVGLIRRKYKQANGGALFELDGDQLYEEGNTEVTELEEILRVNKSMMEPIG